MIIPVVAIMNQDSVSTEFGLNHTKNIILTLDPMSLARMIGVIIVPSTTESCNSADHMAPNLSQTSATSLLSSC